MMIESVSFFVNVGEDLDLASIQLLDDGTYEFRVSDEILFSGDWDYFAEVLRGVLAIWSPKLLDYIGLQEKPHEQ
jgi:hypothetical protein